MTGDVGVDPPVCQDCNQLIAEKQELRDKLRGAYAVVAERQQRLEDSDRNMRAARRQLELFMDDGTRERVTVALALLHESDDLRCKFCREGECDPVAFKFGWCGKARLLAAVEGHQGMVRTVSTDAKPNESGVV